MTNDNLIKNQVFKKWQFWMISEVGLEKMDLEKIASVTLATIATKDHYKTHTAIVDV